MIDDNKLAGFFKAIAHPTRINILRTIYEKDICVNDISKELSINQPNTSQHLAILKNHNLLKKSKKGNEACYKIKDDGIIKIIEQVEKLIKKLEKE